MLDKTLIDERTGSAASSTRGMDHLSRAGLVAGVLALVCALVLIPFLDKYQNSKRQPASVPALVSEAKAPAAASPLLSSVKDRQAKAETPKQEFGDAHVLDSGDTLERLVGRKNVGMVAAMNGISNPDLIKAGQLLVAPKGITFKRRGFRIVDCSHLPQGECRYSHPGADKMCGGRDPLKALTSSREYGLTAEQALQVFTSSGERVFLPAGTVLNGLSFEHGFWHGPIVTTVPMWADRKMEIDGNVYLRFDACCNLGRMKAPEKPVVAKKPEVPEVLGPAIAEPQPAPQPEPVIESPKEPEVAQPEPESIAPSEEPPEETARPSCATWDWFVGTGGDDTGTRYSYTELAAYPFCKEGENGKHYFGIGFKGSIADGATGTGFGWDGRERLIGLAHKYVSYDGWDISSKLLWGDLEENGKMSLYRSQRLFDLVGVSLAYNDYERYLRGERWRPEWNAYLSVLWPTSSDVHHEFAGTPIADTNDLGRFDYKLSAGVRQYLYAGDDWWPFISGGLSIEHPTSKTGNLRIGVADANKIFFASAGINHNFDDGENAFGWDIGLDAARALEFARAEARRTEMLAKLQEDGVTFDEATGALIIPSGGEQGSLRSIGGDAQFDAATGALIIPSGSTEPEAAQQQPKPKAKPVRKPAQESVWGSPWDFER